MNGFGTTGLGDAENLADVQVRLGGGSPPDVISLVGLADVQGSTVDVGIDRDGTNPHLAAGANHANGNLTPVSYQDFLEHGSPL